MHYEHYLVEYCSESLKKLEIHNKHRYMNAYLFDGVHKPFKSVKTLIVEGCILRNELPFNSLFPNLESLTLLKNHYESISNLKFNFPTVKHFTFAPHFLWGENLNGENFNGDDVAELLKCNPQLETLELDLTYPLRDQENTKFIRSLGEYMPTLKFLTIIWPSKRNTMNIQPVHLKNVTDLCLQLQKYPPYEPDNIPFTCSNLKRLKITSRMYGLQIPCILDFIAENKTLTSIDLVFGHNFERIQQLFQNEIVLFNVEELSIEVQCFIYSDEVLEFLKQNRSLKNMSLRGSAFRFENLNSQVMSLVSECKGDRDFNPWYSGKVELIFRQRQS